MPPVCERSLSWLGGEPSGPSLSSGLHPENVSGGGGGYVTAALLGGGGGGGGGEEGKGTFAPVQQRGITRCMVHVC